MASRIDPPGAFVVVGLLTLLAGVAITSIDGTVGGTTLAVGGILLLINRIGLEVYSPAASG